jgi:hypothetical protein
MRLAQEADALLASKREAIELKDRFLVTAGSGMFSVAEIQQIKTDLTSVTEWVK